MSSIDCCRYCNSVGAWPTFPDSAATLKKLGFYVSLAILSNVDTAGFALSSEKPVVEFDAASTAEDIGSYKPADANCEYMLTHIARRDFAKSDIFHVAEACLMTMSPPTGSGLPIAGSVAAEAWRDFAPP